MFTQTTKEKYMSKKVEKSACPICGKKFVKKAVNQKYCSAKCKCVAKRQAEKAKKCSTENNKKAKKPVAKKIEEKVKLPKPPEKRPMSSSSSTATIRTRSSPSRFRLPFASSAIS